MASMPDPIARVFIDPSPEFKSLIDGLKAGVIELIEKVDTLTNRVEELERRQAADDERRA